MITMHVPVDLLALHTHAECCGTTVHTLQDYLDSCLHGERLPRGLPRPLAYQWYLPG